MIFDVISFNGEHEMFELRYNLLKDYVDEFIVCEARSTFSGQPKELTFIEGKYPKTKYYVIEDNYTTEEIGEARNSKYTGGDPRWIHEFLQKESIKKAMTHLQDEDTCYIGDVDEIWEPRPANGIEKLKLRVYTYYLNLHSTEEFWGCVRAKYKDIKNECFNNIRNNVDYRTSDYQGWHFTNQGGLEQVKRKVEANYINQAYYDEPIGNNLEKRFGVQDYIGRDFTLEVDESEWPIWLKENREKYLHLIK